MSALEFWLEGVGLVGPGFDSWQGAHAVLSGEARWADAPVQIPAPTSLPPAERRRTGTPVKLALAVGLEAIAQAGLDARTLATVFSSSGADGDNCHAICEVLASDDRMISPTRFHNSVHNAPSGYWGIATGAMAPSTCLCAYDASFGAGLIEAAAMVAAGDPRCVLIAYDTLYPPPLHAARPLPAPMGVALVLAAQRSDQALAQLTLRVGDAAPDTLAEPSLENLRTAIPVARSLPLLTALARGMNATVVLDYLAPLTLEVDVRPLV